MSSDILKILHCTPNFSYKQYKKLIDAGVALDYFIQNPSEFKISLKLNPRTIDFLQHKKYQIYLTKLEKWQQQSSTHYFMCLNDDNYPEPLKHIPDPPLAVYAIGDIQLLYTKQLAIVGTRNFTQYGSQALQAILPTLLKEPLTITSGMAVGIDTIAHQLSLEKQGKTIAILGTGIDRCYPNQNRLLYQEIQQKGLILSEFLLGEAPKRYHFPKRNRIISGLSSGVLVVEAAQKSGSLITAMHALDQNRDVFAIPGNIFHTESLGCNQLIQMGAKLVYQASDILEELSLSQAATPKIKSYNRQPLQKQNNTHNQSTLALALGPTEKLAPNHQIVVDLINYTGTTTDEIIQATGLTYTDITVILFELEMDSHICAIPGGYKRV